MDHVRQCSCRASPASSCQCFIGNLMISKYVTAPPPSRPLYHHVLCIPPIIIALYLFYNLHCLFYFIVSIIGSIYILSLPLWIYDIILSVWPLWIIVFIGAGLFGQRKVYKLLGPITVTPSQAAAMTPYNSYHKLPPHPFINRRWLISQNERIRLSIVAIILVPARLFLFALIAALTSLIATIATYGLTVQQLNDAPLSGWRQKIMSTARPLCRVALYCFGYYHIPTQGQPAPASQAPVVIANHQSFIDPIYMLYAFFAAPIAAIETVKFPMIWQIVKGLQAITISRTDPTSRHAVVRTMHDRFERGDKGWPQTLVFPEGTCANGENLVLFKPGAFIPKQSIQAVFLSYPLSRNHYFYPIWTDLSNDIATLALRQLCEPFTVLTANYLPVYTPNEAEKNDAAVFAANVRQYIAKYAGKIDGKDLTIIDHGYDDHCLFDVALKTLRHDKRLTVFDWKIVNSSSITVEMIKKNGGESDSKSLKALMIFYQKYLKLGGSTDGMIDYQQFSKIISLTESSSSSPSSPSLWKLFFESISRPSPVGESGKLYFRTFCLSIAISFMLLSKGRRKNGKEKLSLLLFRLINGGIATGSFNRSMITKKIKEILFEGKIEEIDKELSLKFIGDGDRIIIDDQRFKLLSECDCPDEAEQQTTTETRRPKKKNNNNDTEKKFIE